jgi:hypothetical protein
MATMKDGIKAVLRSALGPAPTGPDKVSPEQKAAAKAVRRNGPKQEEAPPTKKPMPKETE